MKKTNVKKHLRRTKKRVTSVRFHRRKIMRKNRGAYTTDKAKRQLKEIEDKRSDLQKRIDTLRFEKEQAQDRKAIFFPYKQEEYELHKKNLSELNKAQGLLRKFIAEDEQKAVLKVRKPTYGTVKESGANIPETDDKSYYKFQNLVTGGSRPLTSKSKVSPYTKPSDFGIILSKEKRKKRDKDL